MEKNNFMRRVLTAFLALVAVCSVSAQNGTVLYHLPSTTLHISVEAECESFTPGIYCDYAKKYLGIEVVKEERSDYALRSIKITPMIEADRGSIYLFTPSSRKGELSMDNLLSLTSQGLMLLSDGKSDREYAMRFPSLMDETETANSSEVTDNLTSAQTTLFRRVRNSQGGFDRIATNQSQVVEKSMEKRAQEAASMILSLRTKRLEIITGDTDATFSGDALRAAVAEITRLEEEYMKLFTGYSCITTSNLTLDIVPDGLKEDELIIAFRISDKKGLVASDDPDGRPIVMEIVPEPMPVPQNPTETTDKRKASVSSVNTLNYRVPAICSVRLLDGQSLLMQSRFPIYQKGKMMTLTPVSK